MSELKNEEGSNNGCCNSENVSKSDYGYTVSIPYTHGDPPSGGAVWPAITTYQHEHSYVPMVTECRTNNNKNSQVIRVVFCDACGDVVDLSQKLEEIKGENDE